MNETSALTPDVFGFLVDGCLDAEVEERLLTLEEASEAYFVIGE